MNSQEVRVWVLLPLDLHRVPLSSLSILARNRQKFGIPVIRKYM